MHHRFDLGIFLMCWHAHLGWIASSAQWETQVLATLSQSHIHALVMLARVVILLPYLLERWFGKRGSVTARIGRMWPWHWSFPEEMGSKTRSLHSDLQIVDWAPPLYFSNSHAHHYPLVDLFPSVCTEGLLCTRQALFVTSTDQFCRLECLTLKKSCEAAFFKFCGGNRNSQWFNDLPEGTQLGDKNFNLSL